MLDIYMREHSRPPKEQPPIFVDNPMFAIGKGNRVKPPAEYVVHKVIAMLSPAVSFTPSVAAIPRLTSSSCSSRTTTGTTFSCQSNRSARIRLGRPYVFAEPAETASVLTCSLQSPIDLTFDDSDDDWQAYEERQESVEEPDAPVCRV